MVFEHGPGDEGGFGGSMLKGIHIVAHELSNCTIVERVEQSGGGSTETRRHYRLHRYTIRQFRPTGAVASSSSAPPDKTTTISLAFPVSDALAPQRSASGELVFAYLPVTAAGRLRGARTRLRSSRAARTSATAHSGNHVLLARVPKLFVHAVLSDPVLGEEAFAAYLPDSEAVRKENRSGGGRKWHTLALALHHETKAFMMVPTEDAPEKVRRKNAVLRPAHLSPALVPNSLLKTVTAGEMHFAHADAVVDMCLQHCLEACPVATVLDCIRVALDRAARGGASAGDDVPVVADLPAPPPPPTDGDGTTVRVRLPPRSAAFDRTFAPEATLHTVLCAIHHESGTKLLAGKKYHFIEPGPPMMARCKADTALDSTFASLGLTGRVALNLIATDEDTSDEEEHRGFESRHEQLPKRLSKKKQRELSKAREKAAHAAIDWGDFSKPPGRKAIAATPVVAEETLLEVWRYLAAEYVACARQGEQGEASLRLLVEALIGVDPPPSPLRIFPVRGSTGLRLHSEHGVPLSHGLSPELAEQGASVVRLAERIVPQLDVERLEGVEGLEDLLGFLRVGEATPLVLEQQLQICFRFGLATTADPQLWWDSFRYTVSLGHAHGLADFMAGQAVALPVTDGRVVSSRDTAARDRAALRARAAAQALARHEAHDRAAAVGERHVERPHPLGARDGAGVRHHVPAGRCRARRGIHRPRAAPGDCRRAEGWRGGRSEGARRAAEHLSASARRAAPEAQGSDAGVVGAGGVLV